MFSRKIISWMLLIVFAVYILTATAIELFHPGMVIAAAERATLGVLAGITPVVRQFADQLFPPVIALFIIFLTTRTMWRKVRSITKKFLF